MFRGYYIIVDKTILYKKNLTCNDILILEVLFCFYH